MPITIGANIASLRAQRQIGQTTDRLASVYERLSSGQRINHASDDAAGLSIAMALQASARVQTQAIRNVNDGISTISIAEGATQELTGILQRQKELATESANGTYGSAQRAALQKESNQLTGEFNRIIATTSFNGAALLDGSMPQIQLQVGTDSSASSRIAVDFSALLSPASGAVTSTTTASSGTIQQDSFDFSTTQVAQVFSFGTDNAINLADGQFLQFSTPDGNGGQEQFYLWLDITGSAVDPGLGGTGIRVQLDISDDAGQVATKIAGALNGNNWLNNNFASASASGDNKEGFVTVTDYIPGQSPLPAGDLWRDPTISYGSSVSPGQYIQFSSTAHDYTVWFNDGSGSPPSTPGRTFIQVSYNLADDSATLLSKTVAAIQAAAPEMTVSSNGLELDLTGSSVGPVAPAAFVGPFSFGALQVAGANSSINSATDRITIASHGYSTGQQLTLSTDGALPGGLSAATTYYAIVVDANTIKLATSAANATAGTAINITSNGSGTMTLSTSISVAGASQSPYISNLDISTASGARSALGTIDSQMQLVSTAIGSLGAAQNRLNSALNTIAVARENNVAAAARIMSADVAGESANLVRQQILQQAAAAVLSQASQQPQLALTLLK